ncbi:MAG: hypothetical protein Q7K55_06655 [Candidatus Levybacteria bacterium]|nr:hypothetical protein [Candidatus Levybacteria bacterium]
MTKLNRITDNPILIPSSKNIWEAKAAFNGCAVKDKDEFHLVYRACSPDLYYRGFSMQISSIGYAQSNDGVHFENHRQLIKPEHDWEIFGCEDPRITKFNDKYFIFYTALSDYPFSASGIKIGLAITTDFKTIEKYPVTTFNSKAMALFPEKVNGKIAAILTANTDIPPSKICIAFFDKEEEIWSKDYWENWYSYLDDHVVSLQRNANDQIEVGAPPIKTKYGWLVIYSYIKNYFSQSKIFGIEAVLLDLKNPFEILGRTNEPILIPQMDYELYGNVSNIVFPSGALVHDKKLFVYYGASDTTCSLATCNLDDLISEIHKEIEVQPIRGNFNMVRLERFEENPIIQPKKENIWEAKATFNPAAIYENDKIHLVYRAMSEDNTSVLGYASSKDGVHIDERLNESIYVPREDFESKKKPGNSGCEDPRITKIGNRFYMCYTAFDGENPPRVALTSIEIQDFLDKNWKWEKPKLISPLGIDDKDACILPRKINGKYIVFHRLETCIWIDFVDDLNFIDRKYLSGDILIEPRENNWDNDKVGIASPPIETKIGWLMLYHGIYKNQYYKVGAALLDINDPTKIISRLDYPILEPEMKYEKEGQVSNVVFPCGALAIRNKLFVYYGGADRVVGVATVDLKRLLEGLLG